MKTIQIGHIVEPKSQSVHSRHLKYQVYLGNNSRNYFTSRKAAEKFQAETRRFLTAQVMYINRAFSEVFSESRQLFFYFAGRSSKADSYYRDIENSIDDKLSSVWKNLKVILHPFKNANQEGFIFNRIETACIDLEKCCDLLAEIRFKRGEAYEKSNLEFLKSQIEKIRSQVDSYGK